MDNQSRGILPWIALMLLAIPSGAPGIHAPSRWRRTWCFSSSSPWPPW